MSLRPPIYRTSFPRGYSPSPLNILIHLQLSCAPRGKELVETSANRKPIHPRFPNTSQYKYTYYGRTLHRLATIHSTADRPTDRAIGIGRLCSSTNNKPQRFLGSSEPIGLELFSHFSSLQSDTNLNYKSLAQG